MEWSEIYESEEKDARIKEEQQENRTAWTVAGFVGMLLVISGGFIVAIARKKREISLKNDTLTASLNEMTGFRKAFFRKQEEKKKRKRKPRRKRRIPAQNQWP